MAQKTSISWTDYTWNPTRGCSRISAGCGGPNHAGGCYAEKIAARFSDPGQTFHGFAERTPHGGRWTGKMALVEEHLQDPLRWRKPRKIFVNSMSDLFHENLPDEAIDEVFAIMALAPQHTFQILTKRADRMRSYLKNEYGALPGRIFPHWAKHAVRRWGAGFKEPQTLVMPLPNVWLGCSVEDQDAADLRVPDLLATPAAVRFLSVEPMLGPVKLRAWKCACGWRGSESNLRPSPSTSLVCPKCGASGGLLFDWFNIDQVICGAESGTRRRPFEIEWAEDLRRQCTMASTAFWFKQDSAQRSGERGRASDALWACKQFPAAA